MNRWIMARKLLLWYQHRCETSIVVLFRSKNANSLQTISCAVLHFYAVEKKNEIEIESEFLWRCYYVPPVESWSLNLQHTHLHSMYRAISLCERMNVILAILSLSISYHAPHTRKYFNILFRRQLAIDAKQCRFWFYKIDENRIRHIKWLFDIDFFNSRNLFLNQFFSLWN